MYQSFSRFQLQVFLRTLFIALFFSATLFSANSVFAQTGACLVQGETLTEARNAYAAQCTAPRVDCDPIGSSWFCSSQTLSANPLQFEPAPVAPSQSISASASRPAAAVVSPVDFPNTGSSNGNPICLTDANSINGYGFENNRSCVVVSGVTATRSNPLTDNRICSPWMEIGYGNYVLQNNVWNSNGVFSNNWSQCIELGGSQGNYIARWDYNWLDRTQGEEFAVKSYPQVYYGRKTEYNRSGTVAETGLPADINQLPPIQVNIRYSETGNAERNVALESFLHTSCETTDYNKHFEMMVWVDKPTIRTPGVLVTTANIDGRTWDVFTNPQLSWGYVAFVAQRCSTHRQQHLPGCGRDWHRNVLGQRLVHA